MGRPRGDGSLAGHRWFGQGAGDAEDELMSIITNGKGHMPKYAGKLSEAEIRGLVEGIRGGNTK